MVPFKEYRMSMFQVVSLSGIVMGCMLLAFYLGVYFGNKIGFENAMNESRENLAKVPIDLSDTGKSYLGLLRKQNPGFYLAPKVENRDDDGIYLVLIGHEPIKLGNV